MSSEDKIPVAEVAKHASPDDCWIVVNDKVYDLTDFAPNHPGGASIVYKYAGKDGSATYNTYHAPTLIETTLPPSSKKGPFDTSTITPTWQSAQNAELTSKPAPNAKPPLSTLLNLTDFETALSTSASQKSHAFISGASNDLLTLHANARAWQNVWFRPRIMRDVSCVNTRTGMLGVPAAMPVWICPMGIAVTAGPEGEMALGRGAKRAGIVHCVATTASFGVEEIVGSAEEGVGEGEGGFFFQLYVDKQRAKTEALLKRLAGLKQVRAVFVTVDLAVVSKREADERLRTADQVGSEYSGGQTAGVDRKGGGLARTTGSFIDWSLSWEDLAWVRRHTELPIVVKGIQGAADARRAMQMGCQGIVVSNHGGRALDSAPATLLVLLELRRDCPEVFDKMEVHIDGGVRRGSDILKAVCLGAKGVGIGRPFQCSVSYGTEGVETAAAILQDELETAMRLCGVTDLNKVRGDMSYLNTTELERSLPPKPKTSWFGALRARL